MKSLDKIKNALLNVTDHVYHYEAPKKCDRYIVWAEDSGNNVLGADNRVECQAIQGTVDFYTKSDKDPYVDAVHTALNKAKIAHYLNSVQYEDNTKLIHYEWVFEVA